MNALFDLQNKKPAGGMLLDRAAAGKEVVITKPVRLVGAQRTDKARVDDAFVAWWCRRLVELPGWWARQGLNL